MNTLQSAERADCTVVTMSKVSDLSYDDAHAWVAEHMQRKNRRGARTNKLVKALDSAGQINGWTVKRLGFGRTRRFSGGQDRKITLKTFIKQEPKGRFYMTVRGHAIAVIDGVPGDDYTPLGRHVDMAWEFIKE